MPQPEKRMPIASLISAGFSLVYAISPIDVIPDLIPLIGSIDDVVVLLVGVMLAMLFYSQANQRVLPRGQQGEVIDVLPESDDRGR